MPGQKFRGDMNLSPVSQNHKDSELWVWLVKCLLNIDLWSTMADDFHLCDFNIGCYKPTVAFYMCTNAARTYISYLDNRSV